MCGNGGVCIEIRMPASSGDPVSSALHMSLAGNKCATLKNDDLDSKIVASARRVLLTEIKFEPSGSYSSKVLDSLKNKYIVLNAHVENDCKVENDSSNRFKLKNGPTKESTYKDSPKNIKSEVILPSPKRILYPPEAIQLGWQSSTPVGAGMINMGNTCYLNSTLQALFHVPSFVNWILNDKIHSSKCVVMNGASHSVECLICVVMKTLQFAQRNINTPVKPFQIYSKLKLICKHLVHGHQEDAHEFLRYLIESMERSYLHVVQGTKLDSYSKETTPLNQIFGGYLRTEVTCLECRHVSTTFQHFQDLLLDIRTVSSVEDALEAYFGREQLGDGEEAYKCEQCHRRVAATKKFSIQKAPNVLCMQLKRFGIMGGKISKHVSLQQHLELTRFMHPSSTLNGSRLKYRLVSMISHIGPSSSCGHYTAMALSCSGQFYLFDDSVVRPVSLSNVLNTNAYVIMYELEGSCSSVVPKPSKPLPSLTMNTNGVAGKSLQNGLSTPQSQSSIHKQSLVLSATKTERDSMSTSPASATATTQQSTSSPKLSKIMNGSSNSSKSLVPYTPNESSDSESENGYRISKQLGSQQSNISIKEHTKSNACVMTVNGITKELSNKTQSLFSDNGSIASPVKDSSVFSSATSSFTSPSSSLPSTSLLKLSYIPPSSSSSSSSISSLSGLSNSNGKNNSDDSGSCSRGSSDILKKDKVTSELPSTSLSLSLPSSTSTKNCSDEPQTLIMNGWHISESSLHSPNSSAGSNSSCSNSVCSSGGQWNVTEIAKPRLNDKIVTITTDTSARIPSGNTTVTTSRIELSNSEDNNSKISNDLDDNYDDENNNNSNGKSDNFKGKNNYSSTNCNSSISSCRNTSVSPNMSSCLQERNTTSANVNNRNSKMWDGSRNNETVNELLKLSHRGYGSSNVNTWNGTKSEVDKQIENDRHEQRKRANLSMYDEELDRGKVKKLKTYSNYGSLLKNDNSNGRKYNLFQDHQDRKNNNNSNSWHASGSNSSNGNNGCSSNVGGGGSSNIISSKKHLFYRRFNNVDKYNKNHRVYRNQNRYNHQWRRNH